MTARPKRVLLATPRGFCAGVMRAVKAVEQALETYGPPVYVRHEIVHNKRVVSDLRKKGAVFVERTSEVPQGAVVLFSAHGVAPEVHKEAARRNLTVIDATCPLVTKVHREVTRYAQQDYDILLIGHEGHEEVTGTRGHAPQRIQIVAGPSDIEHIQVRDPNRVVWASQTTLSVDETMETVQALKRRFPRLLSPHHDDICYATQNRQHAVKKMSPEADLVLVVGSSNSSNSQRLVEVALDSGAPHARLVDHADAIDTTWLHEISTIGVTSGASAPEILVQDVLALLNEQGWTHVTEISAATETVSFALPKPHRSTLSPSDPERRHVTTQAPSHPLHL
ncbi:4-hydroxy-3-methylbut-2-enyl diphosphate reductase [Streptomyces sp. NPDC058086]|uniref:4-hydroxy-3-methylbut-2-enyl diphosphate reductase n=1 Tax=Streptomyces sp. NPDC058086 TaxID=3346334 RepID=UPI0036E988BF